MVAWGFGAVVVVVVGFLGGDLSSSFLRPAKRFLLLLSSASLTPERTASGPTAALHVHSFTPPGRDAVAWLVSWITLGDLLIILLLIERAV